MPSSPAGGGGLWPRRDARVFFFWPRRCSCLLQTYNATLFLAYTAHQMGLHACTCIVIKWDCTHVVTCIVNQQYVFDARGSTQLPVRQIGRGPYRLRRPRSQKVPSQTTAHNTSRLDALRLPSHQRGRAWPSSPGESRGKSGSSGARCTALWP